MPNFVLELIIDFFFVFPDGTSDSGASVSSFRIGEGKNILFCYFLFLLLGLMCITL
jgi:hypothetical protein